MPSTTESGYAKNVANLQELIAFVTAFGNTYNPSKSSLKLAQLTSLHAMADASLNDVINKNTAYNKAINERAAAFDGLKSLSTRVVNAIETTDASDETINDAKGYNRKMQGKRATAIKPQNADSEAPAPNTISVSQQSHDQLIQHFAGLISVLQSEPSYAPNETELSIASLNTKLAELKEKNNAVLGAYTGISNSRIARNNALFAKNTGLVDIALEVKKYVKSVYGASSPEFAQVNRIAFSNKKI